MILIPFHSAEIRKLREHMFDLKLDRRFGGYDKWHYMIITWPDQWWRLDCYETRKCWDKCVKGQIRWLMVQWNRWLMVGAHVLGVSHVRWHVTHGEWNWPPPHPWTDKHLWNLPLYQVKICNMYLWQDISSFVLQSVVTKILKLKKEAHEAHSMLHKYILAILSKDSLKEQIRINFPYQIPRLKKVALLAFPINCLLS